MENQPPQGSAKISTKKILLLIGILVVLAVGYYAWKEIPPYMAKVASDKKVATRVAEINTLLNTPPEGQVISFSDLKPGKNEIGGVTLELFDINSMKKVQRGSTGSCKYGCIITSDYNFSYNNTNIRLQEKDMISGGTAGEDISYEIFVYNNKTAKWENPGMFNAEEDIKIIGVGNIIIFSGSYYYYHGIGGEDVFAYNLSEKRQIQTKNYTSGTWLIDWAEYLDGRIHQFYIKNNKLYFFAPKDQCYIVSDQPTYFCSEDCNMESLYYFYERKAPDFLYAGCVSRYFPLMATASSSEPAVTFTNEYTREAAKYDLILKTTDWAVSSSTATSSAKYAIPKEVEDLYSGTHLLNFQFTSNLDLSLDTNHRYPHPAEWLSPLLGRTLNMALAGQKDEAWKMFQEDYASLSKQYPLTDPVDPIQVEHDLRVMTDKSEIATSTLNY